ncbi:hypothetical protein BDZ97DRAFT_193693 [Flammula alnicola]|nr:hypothetical protein BDZ97DRAFT_193693 [Flammula alnicola]
MPRHPLQLRSKARKLTRLPSMRLVSPIQHPYFRASSTPNLPQGKPPSPTKQKLSTSASRITWSLLQHETSAAPPSDMKQPLSEAASCEGCLKDGVVCSPPPPKSQRKRGKARQSCERCSKKQRKCVYRAEPSVPRKVEGKPAAQSSGETSAVTADNSSMSIKNLKNCHVSPFPPAPAIPAVDEKRPVAGETLVFTPASLQSQGAAIADGPNEVVKPDILDDVIAAPPAAVKQDCNALYERLAKLEKELVQSDNDRRSYNASLNEKLRTLEAQTEFLRAFYAFQSAKEGLLKAMRHLSDATPSQVAIAEGTINHDGHRDLMLGSSTIIKKRTAEALDDLEDSKKKKRRSQEWSIR